MDESVLDKAKLRLQAVEREAEELRAFIVMFEKLSGPLPQPVLDDQASEVKFYGGSAELFSSRDQIINTSREILQQVSPRPLIIGDLFQALIDRGVKIGGNSPKGNLSAKLSQADDIVYVKDEGWYYRPQKDEPPDSKLGSTASEGSVFHTPAKGREAVPGGGP